MVYLLAELVANADITLGDGIKEKSTNTVYEGPTSPGHAAGATVTHP